MNDVLDIAEDQYYTKQCVGGVTTLFTFKPEQLQELAERVKQPLLNQIANQTLNCEAAYRFAFDMRNIVLQKHGELRRVLSDLDIARAENAELRRILREATGGVLYLSLLANVNVKEWQDWDKRARKALDGGTT